MTVENVEYTKLFFFFFFKSFSNPAHLGKPYL